MAVKSQGTKLYYRTGAAGTYALVAIPGLTSIPIPAPSATKIPTSDLDSTGVEYVTGLVDYGTISLPYNFITFGQTGAAAQAAFLAQAIGTSTTYVKALSDGSVAPTIHVTTGVITYDTGRSHITFTGVFGGQGKTAQPDDAIRGTVEVTISGAPTETLKSA